MNKTMASAFQDELHKIATIVTRPSPEETARVLLAKSAGVAGTAQKAVKGVKRYGAGIAKNLGNTMEASMSPVKSIKKGLTESGTWKGSGKYTKHLPVGGMSLTAAGAGLGAPEAFKKQDPSGRGRSRVERISRWTGSNVGGLIGVPHGLSGAIATGIGGEVAGGAVGKAIDRARGYKPPKKFTPGVST